jgi:hypothetical protein
MLGSGSPHPDGKEYTVAVETLGYPNPAIPCSVKWRENAALIWLEPDGSRLRDGEVILTLAHKADKSSK